MNTNTVEQAERLEKLGFRTNITEDDHHREGKNNLPALTLDELHLVLRKTAYIPSYGFDILGGIWFVTITLDNVKRFDSIGTSAQDWTEILIWLLENGHVSAEQVNDILKEG